ncbi:MAG TPA: 50S ribosomal protein L28 [Nitriliruptorales bacterium]|nr:50S ribosomal protein L28 [Nitriliruptorales bacterium]
MAVCQVCGKGPWFGKQVSHSHRRSSRRWDPNVQRLRVWKDGRVQRVDVCTACIKAGKIQRPPVRSRT